MTRLMSLFCVGCLCRRLQDARRDGDVEALRAQLRADGYLLFRGLLDRGDVLAAGDAVRAFMLEADAMDKSGRFTDARHAGMLLSGRRAVTHLPPVLRVLEHDALRATTSALFGCASETFDTKWMRVQGRREHTTPHSDAFRFPRPLLVLWTPLMDVSPEAAPLAVMPGSHRCGGYEDAMAAELPADFHGWAAGKRWMSSSFAAGDVLVFNPRLVHCSSRNVSDTFRISSDTRWSASDEDCAAALLEW